MVIVLSHKRIFDFPSFRKKTPNITSTELLSNSVKNWGTSTLGICGILTRMEMGPQVLQ